MVSDDRTAMLIIWKFLQDGDGNEQLEIRLKSGKKIVVKEDEASNKQKLQLLKKKDEDEDQG